MNPTIALEAALFGLFVFLEADGTYSARWIDGSTRGHETATAALLFAFDLMS
jgi:hypothetical protein